MYKPTMDGAMTDQGVLCSSLLQSQSFLKIMPQPAPSLGKAAAGETVISRAGVSQRPPHCSEGIWALVGVGVLHRDQRLSPPSGAMLRKAVLDS